MLQRAYNRISLPLTSGDEFVYPPAFLQLQLTFAEKVAAVTAHTLTESLLQYTALARILGLGWQVAENDAVWGKFLAAVAQGNNQAYSFYVQRFPVIPRFEDQPHWGCFAYDYYPERTLVRIHFGPSDTSGEGPLSTARFPVRMAELRTMFAHIHRQATQADRVQGASWLYNRHEYRRLFPEAYVASAQPAAPHYRSRALWGQFLHSNGEMNIPVVAAFQHQIALIRSSDEIPHCFPYQVLETVAPIALFNKFYGV